MCVRMCDDGCVGIIKENLYFALTAPETCIYLSYISMIDSVFSIISIYSI